MDLLHRWTPQRTERDPKVQEALIHSDHVIAQNIELRRQLKQAKREQLGAAFTALEGEFRVSRKRKRTRP
jgi:hypothetical protein